MTDLERLVGICRPEEVVDPSYEERAYRQRCLQYKMRFEAEMEEEDPEYLGSKEYKESEEKHALEEEEYIKANFRNKYDTTK